MKYNYGNLSDYEFEELCRDIISAREGVKFESFKKGRDKGIDLRYSKSRKEGVIVQCKHYLVSGFSKLLTSLRAEYEKVLLLNPDRYILMCSVELSPSQKDVILNIFGGYILNASDVIGLNDIESAIDKEILEKNFKLWLSTYEGLKLGLIQQLDDLIYRGAKNKSIQLEEEIRNNIKLYVESKSINKKSLEILNENNVVIISGSAGVGKTTLAKILIHYFLIEGFVPFDISNDINEGFDLFDDDAKQVFWYDDFLGRNFYRGEKYKNEPKRIIDFIKKIRSSKNKKIIFTTREYVLQQAFQTEDLFILDGKIEGNKITLKIEEYTLFVKAKILYNHIYFSELNYSYLRHIFINKNYINIIKHKNYNPRLIEYITNKDSIISNNINEENYYSFVLESLEKPLMIWNNVYKNISILAKDILNLVAISEVGFSIEYVTYSLSRLNEEDIKVIDFNNALKEIENTFVNIKNSNGTLFIAFINPSIRDYIITNTITKKTIFSFIDKLGISFLFSLISGYYSKELDLVKAFLDKYEKEDICGQSNLDKKLKNISVLLVEYRRLLWSISIEHYESKVSEMHKLIINEVLPESPLLNNFYPFLDLYKIMDFGVFINDEVFLEGFQYCIEYNFSEVEPEKMVEYLNAYCGICNEYDIPLLEKEELINALFKENGIQYINEENDYSEAEEKIDLLNSLSSNTNLYFGKYISSEIDRLTDVLDDIKHRVNAEDFEPDIDFYKNIEESFNEEEEIVNLFERD